MDAWQETISFALMADKILSVDTFTTSGCTKFASHCSEIQGTANCLIGLATRSLTPSAPIEPTS
jgi:hypothetical protein